MSEERNGSLPLHPIGVVAERTGLTPDVIRVWERRYGVVEPGRDEQGRRLYTDADVTRLELLARAVAGGRSIGRIAELTDAAVSELVQGDAAARRRLGRPPSPLPGNGGDVEGAGGVVERALERTRALDGAGLEAVLERASLLLGVRGFVEEVAGPLLRRIGDEWHGGRLSAAHEHLASGVAVALLGRLRSRLPAAEGAPLLAVATPAGERHEVGALLVGAVAAAEGWRVLYLGPDLPADEIAAAVAAAGARAVALSVVRTAPADGVAEEITSLSELLAGRAAVLVGGAGAEAVRAALEGSAARVLGGMSALESYLRGERDGS